MSARLGKFFFVVAWTTLVVAVCACEDSAKSWRMPHVLSGTDVPEEVLAASRAVSVPRTDPGNETWPRLGDVPKRPEGFSSQAEIGEITSRMREDRDEGENLLREDGAADGDDARKR